MVALPKSFSVADVQVWPARHDFECVWGTHPKDKPHIKKGDYYVRVVYKLDGKFESDHICLDCWHSE